MRLASEPSSSLAICPRPLWDKTTAQSPQAAIAAVTACRLDSMCFGLWSGLPDVPPCAICG
jgi:hypothetical protein